MRKFSPRPATEDDIAAVAEIEKSSIRPPWSADAFRAELDKPKAHFWVVTDDETDSEVFAYVVFAFPAEQAHIQTIAVKPSARRRGLGAYLMRKVIAYVARERGESIALEVRKGNQSAVQLYQGLGFVVVHTIPRFYPEGEDAYSMIYKIDRQRLTGDPDHDFDADDGPSASERKNLN